VAQDLERSVILGFFAGSFDMWKSGCICGGLVGVASVTLKKARQSNDPRPKECVPADCWSNPAEASDVPNVEDSLAVVLSRSSRATDGASRFRYLEELNRPENKIKRRYIPLYAKTELLLS